MDPILFRSVTQEFPPCADSFVLYRRDYDLKRKKIGDEEGDGRNLLKSKISKSWGN